MARPIELTEALRSEYAKLFSAAAIRDAWKDRVSMALDRALRGRARYRSVGAPMRVPWLWIAAIHSLESDADFTTHLHNGDPLTRRTRQVPAGRPPAGKPPFTWEASATDALTLKSLDVWEDWSICGMLFQAERYNGWGYRRFHPGILSPYLWSGTFHYTRGKYIADGQWSPSAVSQQVGAAAILKLAASRGMDVTGT
ncbi:MAG: peptidoglycan-binding protein [Verrucomicrobiae bacterium]|nr:peptidoglycan-binding protein [Verrucomicrobiae bacterium]